MKEGGIDFGALSLTIGDNSLISEGEGREEGEHVGIIVLAKRRDRGVARHVVSVFKGKFSNLLQFAARSCIELGMRLRHCSLWLPWDFYPIKPKSELFKHGSYSVGKHPLYQVPANEQHLL